MHEKTLNKDSLQEKIVESNNIVVHIDGEIKKPGVYTMVNGDRLINLVEKAGGFNENADTTKINLSIKLKDEMKIYIHKIGEVIEDNRNEIVNQDNKLININEASSDELMKLTGIGPSKAKLIIEYRENKRFERIEDLMNVNGIGKKTFEKIKDKIRVD